MSDKSSPYYHYEPGSLGWLHRRAKEGSEILSADVLRIIEATPDLVPDPVLRRYVILGLRGELKARRGRKRTTGRMLREVYIVATYDALLPRLQARAARQKAGGRRKARADGPPGRVPSLPDCPALQHGRGKCPQPHITRKERLIA